jgi:hypothetical protein
VIGDLPLLEIDAAHIAPADAPDNTSINAI